MTLYASLAGVKVGDDQPVRLMGAINVSPESFYKGSVLETAPEKIAALAVSMVKDGADVIDLGGMSTAPYLQTEVSVEEEARRLSIAVKTVKEVVKVPVSADTMRSVPAEAAIKAGADIINDVRGLKNDDRMPNLISEYGVSAILTAHERQVHDSSPVDRVILALKESLELVEQAQIGEEKIVVDPGIGFFQKEKLPSYVWDCMVLRDLRSLRSLGRPLCIGVSRKSFIGKILSQEKPEDRLSGSLAATAVAVFNGAHIIRTHDVKATVQAVRIAESIRKPGKF
jgi:dihydropteroate synthase